jgi:hypothetical protein
VDIDKLKEVDQNGIWHSRENTYFQSDSAAADIAK